MFFYYGWKLFLKFKPVVLDFVKDTTDESMQAVCSEVISGFMATVIWYNHLKDA